MDSENENGENKLDDVLGHGLKVVFCGTAAGTVSAERGQYYAGPGNKFWKTLHSIGLTERELDPAEFRTLLAKGIGFTDVVKDKSGMDKVIKAADFESGRGRLRREMEKYQPRFLCFNGKRAAKGFFDVKRVEYGLQEMRIGETRVFVAPSTSAAAGRWWDIGYWKELAKLVNET
ncbi:MAG: mismatch-specific DNA-glycosylase [Candidatus Promineifilaceae bacterium]